MRVCMGKLLCFELGIVSEMLWLLAQVPFLKWKALQRTQNSDQNSLEIFRVGKGV